MDAGLDLRRSAVILLFSPLFEGVRQVHLSTQSAILTQMNNMISLDHQWKCAYFQGDPSSYLVFAAMSVFSLSGWSHSVRSDSGLTAHLFHLFYLEPIDLCMRYVLHIEIAPSAMKLFINEREIDEFEGAFPFVTDVTDDVRPQHNLIWLKVACNAEGKFGAVYLELVPCE